MCNYSPGFHSTGEYEKYMRYIDGPRKRQFGGKSEVFRSGHRTPSGKRAQTPASKGDGEPAAGDAARPEKATPPPVEGTLTDQQVAEKKEDARRRPKTSRRCVSARTTRQGRPKSSVYQRTTGPVRLGSQTPRKRPKTGRGRQGEMEATPKARGVVEVESGAKSQTLQFLAEAMDGVYDADSGDSNGATPGDSADATRRRDNEDIAKETGRSSGDDQENTHKVRPIVTRQESSTQTTATEDAGMKPKPKPVTSSTASQAGDGIPIDVVVTVEDTPSVRSDGTASVEGENDVEALDVDPGKDTRLEDLFGEKKKDDDVSAMARERDKNSQTMVILAGGVTEVTESRTEITADDETREIIDGSGRIPEHDTTQAVTDTPSGITGVGDSATADTQLPVEEEERRRTPSPAEDRSEGKDYSESSSSGSEYTSSGSDESETEDEDDAMKDNPLPEDKPPVEGHGESASLLNQENAVIQEHPAANAREENTSGGNEEANVAISPQHVGEPVTNETGSEGKGQSDNSPRESGSSYSGSESETGSDRSSASSRQCESKIQPVPRLQDKTEGSNDSGGSGSTESFAAATLTGVTAEDMARLNAAEDALSLGTTSSTGNQSNESSESSSFTGRYNNLIRYTHNVVSSCYMPRLLELLLSACMPIRLATHAPINLPLFLLTPLCQMLCAPL